MMRSTSDREAGNHRDAFVWVWQAMAFGRDGARVSSFAACVRAAPIYGLTATEARDTIDRQVAVIERDRSEVADLARLTVAERNRLWRRQILNPFAR